MSLILASKSASRQAMLRDAGVRFSVQPAQVDERALEAAMKDAAPDLVAGALAEAKALALDSPGDLVLGSDSLVVVSGKRFDKPADRDEARAHLAFFSGREMQLHSSAALARNGKIIWKYSDLAILKVRPLSDRFIDAYLDEEWPAVSGCVGVFRIEARGIHLFEDIRGNHFTVLGMPLLAVLGALRDLGELQA